MRIATYQPRLIYPDIPPMGRDIYEKGLNCFIDRFLEGYSGKVAFYQFGEIETPGVSDIDLLIVVEDGNWKQSTQKARCIVNSSGWLFYLFTHEPVVVCESSLPSLPLVHTIENCKYLQGTWDPLAQVSTEVHDENAKLMRHVTWDSSLRVAALALDDSVIGLRRALILMHNLLTSAQNGNRLLPMPVPLTLSTEEIRDEVLSAPLQEQESLARHYIKRIVDALNDVDNHLDQQVLGKLDALSTPSPLVVASGHRFLVSLLSIPKDVGGHTSHWLLRNVQVVPVPAYLMILVAVLAHRLRTRLPQLAAFRALPIPQELLQRFDITLFTKHLENTSRLSESYGVSLGYYFPTPFSHRESTVSVRKKAVQQIRKKLLSRVVRNR